MKNWQTFAATALLATALGACSSDGDEVDPGTAVDDDAQGATTGGTTDGGAPGSSTGGEDGGTGDDGSGQGTGGDADREPMGLPSASVARLDTPDGDPFGFTLENDPEPSINGIPTQPKNLRADLVSSDWAEISWAPSNDDAGVTSYVILRSDGQSFELRPELTPGLAFDGGTYEEYAKYFDTTSFIDCNDTRFGFPSGSAKALAAETDGVWNCADTRPMPGQSYTYTVTAVDADGNESQPSEPLTVDYLSNAAADLTRVDDFIDDFDVVWNDEFDGAGIDPARWQTTLVFGSDQFINGEQQYFVPTLEGAPIEYDPFELTDEGTLRINARRTTAAELAALPASCAETDPVLQLSENREHCEFLSGALSSHDRMQFVYGYVEARIRASDVPGALSSFYLYHRYAGGNDPQAGQYYLHGPEIDILEYLGENPFGAPDAFQTYHFTDPNTGIIRSSPTMNHAKEDGGVYGGEFHTFGALWEPNLAIWYIDGVEVRRLEGPQMSQQPMNIINYLVTGSGWAPEPAEGEVTITTELDYIRLYQRDEFRGSVNCGAPGGPAFGVECPAVQPLD